MLKEEIEKRIDEKINEIEMKDTAESDPHLVGWLEALEWAKEIVGDILDSRIKTIEVQGDISLIAFTAHEAEEHLEYQISKRISKEIIKYAIIRREKLRKGYSEDDEGHPVLRENAKIYLVRPRNNGGI